MLKTKKCSKIIAITMLLSILLLMITLILILLSKKNSEIPNMQNVIEQSWNVESTDAKTPIFYEALKSKSSFKVKSIKNDGNNHYTVTVEVSSPYILDKIKEYENGIDRKISDKEIDEKLLEFVNSSDIKTTDIELTVVKVDGKEFVEFNYEFVDAMFGYAYSYSMNKVNSLSEK